MKHTFEFSDEFLISLTPEELGDITGGEPFWYRVGEGIGWLAGKIHNAHHAYVAACANGVGSTGVGPLGAAIR